MKNYFLFICICMLAGIFACKPNKNLSDKKKEDKKFFEDSMRAVEEILAKEAKIADSVRSQSYYIISFISIGTGSDGKSMQLLDAYIKSFERETNLSVNYSKTPWGREGEVDYCIDLKDFSVGMREKFKKESQKILAKGKHIQVKENGLCNRRGLIK